MRYRGHGTNMSAVLNRSRSFDAQITPIRNSGFPRRGKDYRHFDLGGSVNRHPSITRQLQAMLALACHPLASGDSDAAH
jgi:hypothetical protein